MANGYDELGELGATLSPAMASGADIDEMLASGDPNKYLASLKFGPRAAGTLPAVAPPLMPATNATNPVAEAPRNPAVPATVTPTGTPTSAFARPDPNAIESRLVQASAPANAATNPTGVPNPRDAAYRPSIGQRIARGLLGGVRGLAEGGIRGAVLGGVDPAAVGGSAYGAGNRAFSQAARQNAMLQGSLQQQLQQSGATAKTGELEAKGEKEAAQGESYKPITLSDEQATAIGQPDLSGQQMSQKAYTAMLAGKQKTDSAASLQADKDAANKELRDAQTAHAQAETDLANAKKAGMDPNSPQFQLLLRNEQDRRAQNSAAQTRANAYMLNATGGNLGTDTQGNALPGSTQTAGGTPVGSKFQGQYTKSQQNVARFNDVYGALDNLESAAKAMNSKGQKPDAVLVAGALAQPKGTVGKWLQGQTSKGNLTREQRDYVTSLVAAHENVQALRQSVGGGVSDAQVNRIVEMLPNASTPDLDYTLRQTGQIRQTANRLAEGVPQVTGGNKLRSGGESLTGPVKPGEKVAVGPGGHQIVVRGGKWVDPTTGKEVK